VPRRAKCCPECGADEKTGWSDSADGSGLDLPDEEFDYEGFVQEEFGSNLRKPKGMRWIWYVTALALLVFFVIGYFRWG
jgi:hypothetical protein